MMNRLVVVVIIEMRVQAKRRNDRLHDKAAVGGCLLILANPALTFPLSAFPRNAGGSALR